VQVFDAATAGLDIRMVHVWTIPIGQITHLGTLIGRGFCFGCSV